MAKFSKKLAARLAALSVATIGLSGCVYDMGLGYYDGGYGNSYYDCDPYSPYDSYYQCDSGYGFYNIGFGGGWYDSYWYPGYGYYLFDNYGRRHNMGDHHRRYWGERRHQWYRDNHGRGGDGRGRGHGGGRGHGYRDGNGNAAVDQPIAWPEGNGGRRGERPGRRAQPTPPPTGAVGNDLGGRGRDGDGRRGGRGDGRGRGYGAPPVQQGADAVPTPQPMARPGPDRRGEGGGGRGDRGGGRWQQPSGGAAPQRSDGPPPAAPRSSPPPQRAPRFERPDRPQRDQVD